MPNFAYFSEENQKEKEKGWNLLYFKDNGNQIYRNDEKNEVVQLIDVRILFCLDMNPEAIVCL